MPIYILLSFLIALCESVLLTFYHEPDIVDLSVEIAATSQMTLIVICWTISLVSIVYGMLKLCKKNISQQVRHKVMIRRFVAISFFIFFQMYI